MFTIAKTFEFSASHRLSHLPPEHPCHRLHGHNYSVTLEIAGESIAKAGMVFDYRDLDIYKKWIDETFDHRDLNEVLKSIPPVNRPKAFRGGDSTPSTAEYLAEQIFMIIANDFGPLQGLLRAVRVCETPKTWAEYRP